MAQPKCVAKISEQKRQALGVPRVLDVKGNIVINLDYGDVLEITEFEAIAYLPTSQNVADGILPPKRHS